MIRVEGGTANMINGVSRQPSEIRLTSQCEESVNQFPTLTRGLVPRSPTQFKGKINKPRPANAVTHLIERDGSEQYVVTISPSGVEVHDLTGKKYFVHAPNGYGYLAGATSSTLEALTVADHTFILNKQVTVQPSVALSPAGLSGGLIHVVTGDYGETYRIGINGMVVSTTTTSTSYATSHTDAEWRQRHIKTPNIALTLATNLVLPDFDKTVYDNVIHIWRIDGGDFALIALGGDSRIRAHKGTVPNLSDLPRKAPHGFVIKVTGSQESQYDDYYVKFDHPSGTGEGSWKETLAPNIPYKINAATMPHILVREANGSFTFKPADWASREVGDLETNPWPSFVGNKISGMIFFKNRMGFHSGESISMSRNGEFFNFFLESVLTPLDTDPVDVAIAYNDISDIHHAVPLGGEVILFTASVPFRLATNGELFTPKSVSIEPILNMKTSSQVKPAVAADKLYFVNDKPSGSFVHELTFDEASGIKQAPTLTDHVQGYIPRDIHLMVADDDLKILCLVSKAQPQVIYVYKWLWVGQEKVQAAWQKWIIDAPIEAMRFFDEELILVTKHGDTQEILSLNCHEAYEGAWPFVPLLDRLVEVSGTYNAAIDRTRFTLPYSAAGVMALNGSSAKFGLELETIPISGHTIDLKGNITAPVLFGFAFESYCVLSKFHHRSTDNHGSYGNALAGMRLSVANLLLETGNCAYLTVTLDRAYRKTFIYNFSAAQVGTKTAKVGEVVIGKIDKTVSIMSRADDCQLTIGAKTPYPYSLLSYRWTGRAHHGAY